MENLSKENFWNDLEEKYPEAMKVFRDWLDTYKQKVHWDDLFGIHQRKHYWGDIKYHHLPIAMQIGIFIEFARERGGCEWEVDLFEVDWKEDISGYFERVLQPECEFEKE